MPTLGWGELLVILLIVIAIFGTARIAGIGSAIGNSIREFKSAVSDDDKKDTPQLTDDNEPDVHKAKVVKEG